MRWDKMRRQNMQLINPNFPCHHSLENKPLYLPGFRLSEVLKWQERTFWCLPQAQGLPFTIKSLLYQLHDLREVFSNLTLLQFLHVYNV